MRPGPETIQAALFDQVIAEPAESKAGLVIAEARSGDHATEPLIDKAGTVTVAAREAEIDSPTDDQASQVRIRIQGRQREFGQNIEGREGCPVAHQRQLDECLDRAVSQR